MSSPKIFKGSNRGAHQRGGRQAESLAAEPTGEVPCSGARRRDKAERSERRDSWRRSRQEQVILRFLAIMPKIMLGRQIPPVKKYARCVK
jgi:hypothetical protein